MPVKPPPADAERVGRFVRYLTIMSRPSAGQGLRGADLKALYEANADLLLTLTPLEVFSAFSRLLAAGQKPDDILEYLGKIINVLHKGLSQRERVVFAPGSFPALLAAENAALLEKLALFKPYLTPGRWQADRSGFLAILGELVSFDSHYLKKENILFPSMEKVDACFDGLAIMWSLHGQVRGLLKQIGQYAADGGEDNQVMLPLAGRLVFAMHGLVIKEDLLLFPAAADIFDDDDWAAMLAQSHEYGFAYIDPPAPVLSGAASRLTLTAPAGQLSLQEALLLFDALPVDITFVDEDNKVRYFNKPKDRFFPRSPAVIGRDVSRCHPAASVHVVEEIISAFRAGRQEQASFWLEVRGRMVLIQYFALRDENAAYRGVLEVSQDITGIRSLEGQRRLLSWES